MDSVVILEELVAKVSDIPADQNPYLAFRDVLHERTHVSGMMNDGWIGLIYCDIVLLAISLVCYIWLFVLRYKKGNLWFFKLVDSTGGRIVTPHTNNCLSLFAIGYALSAGAGNIMMVCAYAGIGRDDAYQWLFGMYWPFTLLAIVSELHGISIFLLFASPLTQRLLLFGSLYMLVFLGTAIPYSIAAYWSTKMHEANRRWADAVMDTARKWKGEPFAVQMSWLPAMQGLMINEDYGHYNQLAHKLHVSLIILVTGLFMPVAVVYGLTLRRQIKGLQTLHTQSTQQSGHIRYLRASYKTIALEMGLVLLAATAYVPINSQWAFAYSRTILDEKLMREMMAIRYSIFPLVSVFISGILLYRALHGHKDDGKAGSTPSFKSSQPSASGNPRYLVPEVPLINVGKSFNLNQGIEKDKEALEV